MQIYIMQAYFAQVLLLHLYKLLIAHLWTIQDEDFLCKSFFSRQYYMIYYVEVDISSTVYSTTQRQ